MINIIYNLLKGTLYGSFSIIPGLSGSAMAVYLNDYDKILDILIIRKSFKNNILYIISIGLGFLFGIIISSNVLLLLFNKYFKPFIIAILFINIFIIISTINKYSEKIIKILISIIFVLLMYYIIPEINISITNKIMYIFLVSFLYSLGKVIPGVSTTSILININSYNFLLQFFSNPIYSFFNNMIFWGLFWIMFLIYSLLLLKLVYKHKDKLYLVLIDVQVINILSLLK